MYFEVFVPGAGSGMDVKLQIQADSWRQALAAGLQHNNITMGSWDEFFVELGDNSYAVTDARARKVYRVRGIDDVRSASQVLKALSSSHLVVPDGPVSVPSSGEPSAQVGFTNRSTGRFRSIGAADLSRAHQESGQGRVLQEQRLATGPQKVITPEETSGAAAEQESLGGVSETALEDVFLELPTIMEPGYAMEDAIDFVLDIAMRYIPCSHGGVLFASDQGDSLYFASARGKNADPLLDIDVPIDKGHASFALRSGISLTVVNATHDNRYDPTISRACGVQEKTMLCAPIQQGDRAFGVIMLINREQRDGFTQYDNNIVSYIASQMGVFIQRQLDAQPLQ